MNSRFSSKMKTPSLHKSFMLALSAGLLLFPHSGKAGDLLFEDTFGHSLTSQEKTDDFNLDLPARQSGALATAPYSLDTNLEPWQVQVTPHRSAMVFTLYLRTAWLHISPSWELKQEDGHYSLSLEMGFPKPGEAFQMATVVLGLDDGPSGGTQNSAPAGAFALLIQDGQEPLLRISKHGNEVASAAFSPKDPTHFVVTLEWEQKGSTLKDMKISIDGKKTAFDAETNAEMTSRRLMIGGTGKMNGATIPSFRLDRLEYSKN